MNSKIILVKNINIDRQYTNVLSYSEQNMLKLCLSENHLIAQANNYSFIRSTGTIMTQFAYEQCLQANYIAFQNPDYSNKWFFAWIDDVIYKGNKNTEITFTVDAWTTWFDKWTKKTCFINRQHVNNDTIGLHTVSENLDIGDVVEELETKDVSFSEFYYVGVFSSWNPATKKQFDGLSVYTKQIFPKQLYLFDFTKLNFEGAKDLLKFLVTTNTDGHIEDIGEVFIIPSVLISPSKLILTEYNYVGEIKGEFYTMNYSDEIEEFTLPIDKVYTFNDYQPKNNKCFVYPYNYLLVTNNVGNTNIYKYEDFSTNKANFKIEIVLSIGCSGRAVPLNYKRQEKAIDEGIPLGKYPTCAWSSDAYTNWLTQNAVNIPTKILSTLSSVGIGIATTALTGGNVALGVAAGTLSLSAQAAGTIGEFREASMLPNIEGGQNTSDVNFASEDNTFIFRAMRVKTENLKIIDDYFTRFGYAIKKLELPNITGRRYWNYVEIGTQEEIGYGEVPSKYMDIINNACRRGVTIWHEHNNIGNYNLNNIII